MEVLELARWPVGGIRTYFRYVFAHEEFREHHLTFVVPGKDLQPVLRQYLGDDSFGYVATRDTAASLFLATARLLARGNYSLVHSHGFTAGTIAAPLCSLFGVPHLMTVHDAFQKGQFVGWRGCAKRRVLEWLFRGIDIIHTVTEDGRNNILEYLPSIQGERICTILHGIDVDEFSGAAAQDFRGLLGSLDEHDYLIGFFGRFMAPKGFRHLVAAMEILVKHRWLERRPVVLTFGSDGYFREDYEAIEDLGLGKYFIQLPHTDDMPGALKGIDLVAMPSIWEACGLVAMEALVSGVPIVGTSCQGLREVLRDTPAVMVPPGDAAALADAIAREMNAPRRHVFEQYAPVARGRFSTDRSAAELMSLYRQMTASSMR